MSDEGRIKISYAPGADGQMHVVLTDMSSPDKAVEGIVYWSKEVNPTNVPRPGGPRGELANFKFIRSEFEKVSDDFKGHLAEAGFTGRGFNPIPGQPGGITPIPAGYTMPLEGNEIALAAPDTSITSTMQISLPKDMVITPPVVREPWPAIPTPFDPRRELEGYGSPKKAESTMPPPKKAEPEKKTPAQTETPTPAPRESENTKDGKIRVDDLPGELPKELGPLYEGANENHQEAIAKLQAWQNSETGKQADNETKTKVQSRLNYIQLLLNQQQRARTDEATKTEAKTDDKKGEGEAVQKEGEPGKDEEKKEQPRWIQRMRNPIKAFQRLYAQAKASKGMGHA